MTLNYKPVYKIVFISKGKITETEKGVLAIFSSIYFFMKSEKLKNKQNLSIQLFPPKICFPKKGQLKATNSQVRHVKCTCTN